MTEVSFSFNESTLANLRDYSARQSRDLNQCVVEIVEKHLKEQEQLDKIAKARVIFEELSQKTLFSLGGVTCTEEELYEL